MMEYKIYCQGTLIAVFLHEVDRDQCLDYFSTIYDDVTLSEEPSND